MRHPSSPGGILSNNPESELAAAFTARLKEARSALQRQMVARGLLERDGWRVMETTRHANATTQLVLRPIHRVHPAPPDLEYIIDGPAAGNV